jgi:exopolysaccharide biosynthesis protein
VVFAARGRAADFLRLLAPPGDTLRWTLGFAPAPGPVREMVGGHPVLLRGGEAVPDAETGVNAGFSATRHPRSAVGWRADGTLLLVAVDGRQPGYSVGMSLAEVRDLFRGLGAVEALNLDGGGSTALVVRGGTVNRPSDREGERPVANALVVLGPAPGTCSRR